MLSFDLSVVDIALAIAMIILLLLLFSGEKKGQPSTESKKGLMKLSTKLKALFRNTQEKLSAIQLTTNSKKGLMKLSTKLKGIVKTIQEKPSTNQPSTKPKTPMNLSIKLKRMGLPLFIIFVLSMTASVVYSLTLLDKLVHGTLYYYGLRFSYDWAVPYWTILRIIEALVGLSAVVTLTTMIHVYRKHTYVISVKLKRMGLPLFIIFVLSMTASVVYSLTLLDKLVHGTLYSYGLQFSYDWAVPYWTILRIIEALVGLSAVVTLTSMIHVYRKHTYSKPQMKTTVTEKVDAPSFATEPQEQSIFGLVKCTHCGNSYSKPFQALELQGDKFRTVNVCPFCSEVIQPVPRQVESKQVKKAVQKQKKNKQPK